MPKRPNSSPAPSSKRIRTLTNIKLESYKHVENAPHSSNGYYNTSVPLTPQTRKSTSVRGTNDGFVLDGRFLLCIPLPANATSIPFFSAATPQAVQPLTVPPAPTAAPPTTPYDSQSNTPAVANETVSSCMKQSSTLWTTDKIFNDDDWIRNSRNHFKPPAEDSNTVGMDWVATPVSMDWEATPVSMDWEATPVSMDWEATPVSMDWEVSPTCMDWEVTAC